MLGSLHTEMQALLQDRSAPLYQRTTATINLGHLDIASLLELLKVPRALLLLPLLLRRPVRLLRGVALRRDAP